MFRNVENVTFNKRLQNSRNIIRVLYHGTEKMRERERKRKKNKIVMDVIFLLKSGDEIQEASGRPYVARRLEFVYVRKK